MASSEFAPRVAVHYGIPSTASILAFDPIQRLLAIGTLDGRIKVFLQNQGFLVSVSNENEIQVWDLEKRRLSSNIQWESNITAFAVISGTNFIYVGDEYGFVSVLKYDAEEANILQLPYHVPPNLIAEGAGILLPDHQSVVGVLSQPCSCGNRVLIAFENGLIILWDVTEDRAIHVRGYKDLQLKDRMVVNFSNNENHTYLNDSLDNEETEKEISSLCWASPDGSVLAVGYVDGDILLWDLSVSDNGKVQRTQKPPNDVVKIQLSSGDRRLPVIVLHWSPNKAQNGSGGQLLAYGGADMGSEEVLTMCLVLLSQLVRLLSNLSPNE
ncbi:UNVERIFIED_CONTAM: Syntaxin-binding protein 5-like [Sesamum radiatum]|uniref:Syntaxin-binding protein 5-like n=1 Tax=Sesamum radiatum TaxID=300843 RepID=A0AAW2NCP3_SESRA